MYRLWFTFIITLFSCFHSMTATTHDKPFFFQHLTMEDGLSNNHVSAIFQSKDGILWLGTQKGLNCYDGHNFRLYKKRDSSTANSIRGNGIKKILQDRDNNIWVQHEKGTDEINYITRNVRHGWAHDSIGKSVIDICTDYNQQLLILCDQEVWQYIKPSRSYKRLFTAPENPVCTKTKRSGKQRIGFSFVYRLGKQTLVWHKKPKYRTVYPSNKEYHQI